MKRHVTFSVVLPVLVKGSLSLSPLCGWPGVLTSMPCAVGDTPTLVKLTALLTFTLMPVDALEAELAPSRRSSNRRSSARRRRRPVSKGP